MNQYVEKMGLIGIVPVVKIDDSTKAVPLAKALIAGGIPCAEITFRTDAAADAIKEITKAMPNFLVGAGTIINIEQLDLAINAGAKFIVSPGLNSKIVKACMERNVPIIPGCANPSDVEAAIELGLDVVKFFPAEQAGGIGYIKAISGPYNKIKFMPTGGINEGNVNHYLSYEKVICCGGSWMVNESMIQQSDFDGITALCKRAVFNMHDFKVLHIGINEENTESARKTSNVFHEMFDFAFKEGNSSFLSEKGIEIMKAPYKGINGHIGISVNNIKRAIHFFEYNGISFDYSTKKMNHKGDLVSVYFFGEFSGFAVHLIQKNG